MTYLEIDIICSRFFLFLNYSYSPGIVGVAHSIIQIHHMEDERIKHCNKAIYPGKLLNSAYFRQKGI